MPELKLFFVYFSIHKNREYVNAAGYIFARDKESLKVLLDKAYGEVIVRYAEEVEYYEGKVLYGERWVSIGKEIVNAELD